MQLTDGEKVTTFVTHINAIAIHKLMKQVERLYDIPPTKNIADHLAMLQVRGIVTSNQAEEIRKIYAN